METGERATVRVAGAELGYSSEGEGLPLLSLGSSIYYPRTFSRHLKRSCRVVCADLPHFVPLGASFRIEDINLDVYADCIEAVRVAAGFGRIVLVGHSHHGNVALEYVRRFPENVSQLVLIGTPPVNVAQTRYEADQHWTLHASKARRDVLAQRRNTYASLSHSREMSPSEEYICQYVRDAPLYWNDPHYDASWLWRDMQFDMRAIYAFRDLFSDYELNWDTALLTTPILVVMGKHDYAVPYTLWNDVLSVIDNLTFRRLEQSGHTPQLEQAEAFDRTLLDWLTASSAFGSSSER